MSVEKYVPEFENGRLKHESKPYTQIHNDPLQGCKNLAALGLWVHLQSRNEGWVVSIKNIQNHFTVGRDKVYDLINYLICAKLLRKERVKRANGTFAQTHYVVLNGSQFVKNQPLKVAQPLPASPDTGLPLPENPYTINNRFIQIKEKTKKENISYASDDARSPSLFENFWKAYPRKKDKLRAEQIWIKNKCEVHAEAIFKDLATRSAHDAQWQDKNFIPYPTTYLRDQRWTDELTPSQPAQSKPAISAKEEAKQYSSCSACQRPHLHCECGRPAQPPIGRSKENETAFKAAMAKLKGRTLSGGERQH